MDLIIKRIHYKPFHQIQVDKKPMFPNSIRPYVEVYSYLIVKNQTSITLAQKHDNSPTGRSP